MKKIVLIMAIILLYIPLNQSVHAASQTNADLKEEIIYDIVIDRFNNGSRTLASDENIDNPYAYQGGDLKGITMKLDDIKKLGFTTISISPIMENAADGYHGYWVEDFFALEEQFGTMEDLNHLIEEAHKRDMEVIVEFVMNYVALSHPIVSDSSKQDWTTNVKAEPTPATSWLEESVQLNQEHPEVVSHLQDAATFWMQETSIDGFKLHAADQASNEFLKTFTAQIKEEHPDFYLLADVLDPTSDISQLRANQHIDAIENYAIFNKLNEVLTKEDQPITEIYNVWEKEKSEKDLLFVDTKNTARFSNNFAENGRNALTTWKLALTYLYTAQGVPTILQGSELPMYGPSFLESQQMVQFQNRDPDLGEFHERISAIREQFPALSHGDFSQVATSEGMSIFKRTYEEETIYVALNNDSESRTADISGIDANVQLRGLLGDNLVRANEDGVFKVGLPRETAEVFMIEENEGFNWGLIVFIVGVFILFIVAVILLSRKDKRRKNN